MNWTNGIHDDYYNICKANKMMGGNVTDSRLIWKWIQKNSNDINADKHGNILGWKIYIK